MVEAAPKSGSLITARLAGEIGPREVMAVPGSPLDPRAQGCNGLIRDGATLIQSAADILELIRPIDPAHGARAPDRASTGHHPEDASDAERRDVAGLLGPVPVAGRRTDPPVRFPPAIVQTAAARTGTGRPAGASCRRPDQPDLDRRGN